MPACRTPGRRCATSRPDSGISGILGPKLNPYLDKLTLIRGLDFLPTVNHNYGGLLGNFSSCTNATPCDADALGDVPDHRSGAGVLVASSIRRRPGQRYLHISQGVVDSMSYGNGGQAGARGRAAQGAHQPARRLERPLRRVVADPGQRHAPPAPNTRRPARSTRCSTSTARCATTGGCRGDDKQKVEQYVTLISELQARLSTRPMLSCTRPAEPQSLENNSGTDPADIRTKWDLFLDLVAAALMCDRTRIITIGVHKALGPGPDPNDTHAGRPLPLGGRERRHLARPRARLGQRELAAHAQGHQRLDRGRACSRKLLEKLDVTEAGDSTLLDNSLVYWGNELGFNHIGYSVPCLLAGSAGGFIKPGRYLDYIDWEGHAYFSQEDGNVIQGIPHNQFLVTVLQAMGLVARGLRARRPGRATARPAQRARTRPVGRRLRPRARSARSCPASAAEAAWHHRQPTRPPVQTGEDRPLQMP